MTKKDKKKDRKRRFFFLYASVCPMQHMDLPGREVAALLLKSSNKHEDAYSTYDKERIKKYFVPKIGKGRFGQSGEPTYADHLIYLVSTILHLPMILSYDSVVFITPPFFNSIIIPVLKLFRKKIYVVVMDAQIELALSYKKKLTLMRRAMLNFARKLEFFTVRNADKVFVVSSYLKDLYYDKNKKVFLIPNGADVKLIDSIKPKRKFKEFTITYLGGFEEYRGIDLLIDAFRMMRKEGKFKLLLIGSGIDYDRLKEIAKGEADIVFTGFLKHDQAMSFVKGSDVAVMPSRDTIQSRTISSIKCFEYIAAGVPQIVTDTGDHAYWTKKLGTGLVVKDNPKSIADAIKKLYDKKSLRQELHERCVKRKGEIDFRKTKEMFIREVLLEDQ